MIKQLQEEILVLDIKKELSESKNISHKTYKINSSLYIRNWDVAKGQLGHKFYMCPWRVNWIMEKNRRNNLGKKNDSLKRNPWALIIFSGSWYTLLWCIFVTYLIGKSDRSVASMMTRCQKHQSVFWGPFLNHGRECFVLGKRRCCPSDWSRFRFLSAAKSIVGKAGEDFPLHPPIPMPDTIQRLKERRNSPS